MNFGLRGKLTLVTGAGRGIQSRDQAASPINAKNRATSS